MSFLGGYGQSGYGGRGGGKKNPENEWTSFVHGPIATQIPRKWFPKVPWKVQLQHGRYLENWYLEAGRHLGASEANTEVGVL